jgi:serine/threonine-protein kinase
LILECLQKEPARRPQSASALRSRLAAVAEADPWSEEAARAWWERWRERPDRRQQPQDAPSGTMSVSMLGRSG